MKRYCKNCKQISEAPEQDLKFCANCGTPFEQIGEGPSEVQRIIMARDLTSGTVQPGAMPE